MTNVMEITNSCTCTEEDGTDSLECWGCWTDNLAWLQEFILDPWIQAHNLSEYSEVIIESKAMNWDRRAGFTTCFPDKIVERLGLNGDYTLTFRLENDNSLTCLRTSHDEPTGSSFTISPYLEGTDN